MALSVQKVQGISIQQKSPSFGSTIPRNALRAAHVSIQGFVIGGSIINNPAILHSAPELLSLKISTDFVELMILALCHSVTDFANKGSNLSGKVQFTNSVVWFFEGLKKLKILKPKN